ncbi:MAG: Holliday junction resolvase [Pseudomonadota bacterium]|jgi:putative Holliday junction resolvase
MPDTVGTVLAFDFGTKRIGVAVGEKMLGVARELDTIRAEANAPRFAAIEALIRAWQPSLFVVGLPCHPDGVEHEMSARARRFANQLRGRFGLPVELVDERYTSSLAESELKTRGLDWQDAKQTVDAAAARIILQSYFDDATRR